MCLSETTQAAAHAHCRGTCDPFHRTNAPVRPHPRRSLLSHPGLASLSVICLASWAFAWCQGLGQVSLSFCRAQWNLLCTTDPSLALPPPPALCPPSSVCNALPSSSSLLWRERCPTSCSQETIHTVEPSLPWACPPGPSSSPHGRSKAEASIPTRHCPILVLATQFKTAWAHVSDRRLGGGCLSPSFWGCWVACSARAEAPGLQESRPCRFPSRTPASRGSGHHSRARLSRPHGRGPAAPECQTGDLLHSLAVLMGSWSPGIADRAVRWLRP